MNTVNNWTRPRNDSISTSYDTQKNNDVFKYIVYSPEYLQQESCVPGNTFNCNTYQAPDLASEQRIGQLTNLREIQRHTTNNNTLGILTTPDVSSGRLLDSRLINDMSILESKTRMTNWRPDPSTAMNEHFQEDPRAVQTPALLYPRQESTRVNRRNAFAKQC